MRIATLLLALVFPLTTCSSVNHLLIPAAASQAELATHMILFLDKTGATDAECTATAVGPHAFMTASHCNEGSATDTQVHIDLSLKTFNLIAVTSDGRDHVIYLTDATFTNFVIVRQRSAIVGEHVHMWGCGEGEFPPRELTGKVLKSKDKSDIDAGEDSHEYSLWVIPGDSGSAIYGDDGSIIALVTYSHKHISLFGTKHESKSFGLAFTPEQLSIAATWAPDNSESQT